jgi:hypothetical protein
MTTTTGAQLGIIYPLPGQDQPFGILPAFGGTCPVVGLGTQGPLNRWVVSCPKCQFLLSCSASDLNCSL